MRTSIAAEKTFDKIPQSFITKILDKKVIAGKDLKMIKAFCEKLTLPSSPMFKESYTSNIRNKMRILDFTTSTLHKSRSP